MRSSNVLQTLIESSRDNERMLRHESGFVDTSRRATLTRLADERETTVEQLQAVHRSGRRGGVSGSWIELLRELRRSLRVALGGRNSGDAVAACRHSMNRAEALYDRAVRLPLSKEMLDLILQQRNRVRHANVELMAIQF
jgi:uncharacterized protein (TIGR02284 family)